jgi:hypothetical protein
MSEELHELHEHAHEAHERPSLAPVTLTMSALAVLLAAASLLGHRAHTEELLHQSEASDRWAEYQAKSIRRHGYEQVIDLLGAIEPKVTESTQALKEKYGHEVERARHDQDEIMEKAKELEAERDQERRKADRFDLGEVVLEVALVITSLCLLTGRRAYFALGAGIGALGIALTVLGFFRH